MRTTANPTCDAQSLDATFGLLRNSCRRYTLAVLSEREPPVSLDELAEAVAEREAEASWDGESAEPTDEVAKRLHHVHLPKLADANVVEYDREADEVTLARIEAVAPLLDAAGEARAR